MLTLDQLGRAIDTVKVTIRGVPREVRVLPVAVTSAIRSAIKMPEVPTGPARGRGSLADFEPDYHDPAYRAASDEWYRKVHMVEAMAALGIAVACKNETIEPPSPFAPVGEWKVYADAAWAQGSAPGGLSNGEVARVVQALNAVDEEKALDDARGKSAGASASAP